ncbi:MAG: tetratricopeptide repeat protein [Okeania sp. SIO2C9]|uniref:tetratricopeptide repeat protein n=1 Tax=Okeania sp. SIO2C9 TaxID=2607791 RepID=UPI0013C174BD|nr:tetratricopeptide repeat protein [Okeania sp. SIO2C9]NEQ76619.1 tetratricopeptide repeat protein [Okeania sp. SIO2C9]
MSSESSKVLKLAEEKASRGLLYQKQGKLEAAILLYQEALTLVPDLHYIQYNLGIAFQHQGNLSAAYIHYQQAIAHHPQHIQAYYNIGIVLQQQGLLDRAISSYQKVINLSQGKAENILIQVQAYSNWGSILVKEGRAKEAIEIFQQAINLKPDDASLYNNQGQAFLELGKVEKAITNYRQALALKPQLIVARHNLGKVYQQQGLHSEAIVYFQEIIKQYPENLSAHSNCAFSFLELGKLAAAIPHLKKVINHNSFVESYCEKADFLTGLDELEKAKRACARFLVTLLEEGRWKMEDGKWKMEEGRREKEEVKSNKEEGRRKKEEGRKKEWMGTEITTSQNSVEGGILNSKEIDNLYLAQEVTTQNSQLKTQNLKGRKKEWMGTEITTSQNSVEGGILNSKEIDNLYLAQEVTTQNSQLKTQNLKGRKKEWMGTEITTSQNSVEGGILNSKEIDNLYLAEVRKNLILTYSSLGNVLFEYGEYSQSENYYQKALKFQPLNVELHLKLGNSLAKQKRFNTAIIVYHLGLAVEPDNSAISQALEKVLAKRNNSEEIRRKKEEGRSRKEEVERKKEEGRRKKSMDTQILTHCQNPVDGEILNLKEEDKNNQVICQGLNCQPCLKRIFKQLQPINLGNGIHSLSREKTQTINIDFPETPKFVTEVVNGKAWIVPQKNNWMICNAIAIINQENQLLAEVSREYPGQLPGCDKYDINNHRFFSTEELPPLEQINGTVAVLSGLSGNVYFHWMVDILPRIEILRRNGINFDQIDWFLINSTKQPFQQETLRILGIPEDKIIESDRHPYIQAKKLIVPSFSSHLAWVEKWVLEFHRQVFLNRSMSTLLKDRFKRKENQHNQVIYYPERIYISRNKAKYRRVINEEKVIDLLNQYDFISIELETLSVVEQVALFANAKVIVSPHGSGLTNIMFCTPETTVIELVSPNYIKHYYWAIAQKLGLKYYYLVGEEFTYYPIRQIMYPNSLTEDIIINLSKLEKMLSQASIIKVNSHPTVKFLSEEQTSQEKILLEKKLSNSQVDVLTFSQKGEEDNVSRTAVSNQMAPKVNQTEAATHFHKKALFYLDQKKLDEAKAACEQALKNQPDFAEACKTMGIIVQKEGQIEAAFEWYSRAINIQPNFAEAYVNIGTLYARKQQWQEAIEYYQKAITIKPDLAPAYRNIAKAYQKVGKVVEAAIFQYKAYCLEPTNIKEKEYINLGNTLLKNQKLTEAISCYRSAIKLNPNSAVAYQNIAEALSQTGDFEESNTCYRKAIKLGITNLSNVNGNLGKKISNLSAKNTANQINSTIINQEEGKNKNSKVKSQKLKGRSGATDNLSVERDHVEAYKRLGKMLQNQGQAAEAWQWYTKAISIAPKDPEIYRDLGSLYGQQQQWQEAIQCYQRAIEICPNMADVNRYLATALTHVGQHAEASKFWEKAYSLEPETATAEEHLLLGNTLLRMNLVEQAISCYYHAIQINPKLAVAYQNLGEALKLQSNSQLSHPQVEEGRRNTEVERRKKSMGTQTPTNSNFQHPVDGGVLNPKSKDQTYVNNSDINHHIYSFKPDITHKIDGAIDQERVSNSDIQLVGNTGTFQSPLKYFEQFFKQLFYGVAAVFNFHHQSSKKYLQPSKNIPILQGTNNYFPLKPEIDFNIKYTTETAGENLLFPVEVNLTNTDKNEQKKALIKDASNELEKIEEALPKIDRPQIESSIVKSQKLKERNQKWMGTQTPTNFQHPVDGGVLNPKDKIDTQINAQYVDVTKSAVVLPDVYIQKAIAYNQEGLYEQAIAQCQQAIAVQPEMAMAYKILGNAQQKIGSASQLQEAKQNYLKAISLDSQDPSIHVNLGSLYAQEELWEKAIPCYQKAIAIKPDFAGAYRNLAKAWTQVGKQAEAADCWYEAYTLTPENITPDQHLNLGNTLCRQGQLTKAIFCYQKAIKLNPNYTAAYQNLATTLKRQGKVNEAAIYAQKAREISNISVKKQVEVNGKKLQYVNPEDVLQSYSNSMEEVESQKLEIKSQKLEIEEVKSQKWMGTQNPINFQHPVDGGVLHPKSKDKKEKEKLPQINQADLIKQAEAYFVNSKFYDAIATCEEAISIKPHAVAYQIMGKSWVEINKPDEAIVAYQKAIEIKPNFAEIYVSLGELYVQHQRQKEAIIAYKKAIKFAPDLKDSYRGLVEVLLDQGKVDEAEELSYNALMQHPGWATAQEFCTLGSGLIAENKTQQGIACFYQAIELDPKLLEAHYSLGKALAEKGEWLEAINCYQQVIELEANETQENYSESEINIDIGEVYHLLGDALQEIGKLDESVAAYQGAIEITGNEPY